MIKHENFSILIDKHLDKILNNEYSYIEEVMTMSSFTSPLVVKHLDGKNWEVMCKFVYHVNAKKFNEVIVVPKGFITDFASIPRILYPVMGRPTGKFGKAAVLHDYLYRTPNVGYSRKESDKIFRQAMKVLKVGRIKRNTIYFGVRLFGRSSWRA